MSLHKALVREHPKPVSYLKQTEGGGGGRRVSLQVKGGRVRLFGKLKRQPQPLRRRERKRLPRSSAFAAQPRGETEGRQPAVIGLPSSPRSGGRHGQAPQVGGGTSDAPPSLPNDDPHSTPSKPHLGLGWGGPSRLLSLQFPSQEHSRRVPAGPLPSWNRHYH